MNDVEDIRNRIKNRRSGVEKRKHQFSIFNVFYRCVMVGMGICVIVLALLVNEKVNIIKLPAFMAQIKLDNIGQWIPFEQWFSLKDRAVSSVPSYIPISENKYQNGSNTSYAVYDGIVLHIQQHKNLKFSITLKQDNGVIATYGNLNEVQVQKEDRVLKSKAIGVYEDYVTIDFMLNHKDIPYGNALLENPN